MAEILTLDLLHNSSGKYHKAIIRDVNLLNDTLLWFTTWWFEMFDFSGNPIYPDSNWEVTKIWEFFAETKEDKVYIMEYNNAIQGYIVVQLKNYSGIDSKPCTYVRFVATAPWNRREKGGKRVYREVGTLLLATAVIQGYLSNNTAAVELEALPEAESFYRKIGMVPTGHQKKELSQYRFDNRSAQKFINEITHRIRQ